MQEANNAQKRRRVLVTGVTGYIGGRLVPLLLDAGFAVRVLVRGSAKRLENRPWFRHVEVAVGDVLEPESLNDALQDMDAAYYLIHSMSGHAEFSQRDIEAAQNFARAAAEENVAQIIYLGGLGDSETNLSKHLRSRQETGEALRQFNVPVTEFRAGMVVGSGSLSFEMLRHLTERLPAMIAPRWVYTKTQPIAVRDVLNYLVAALETPASKGEIIEIGGTSVLTNAEMMKIYARIRGLRRLIVSVPVLTPRLSSYWVHWMTPVPADVASPLIEGLRNELVVRSTLAQQLFPEIEPLDYETAVRLALKRLEGHHIDTLWTDALASSQGDVSPVYFTQEQGMLIERRRKQVAATPDAAYRAFASLGGQRGWPPYTWLWQIRGALDRLVGGVGMRRGRRHPEELRRGEALDFWRVEAVEPPHLLRLRAEMKLPGHGWLQFETEERDDGLTELVQTAFFAPKGLGGLIYWYAIYPLHGLIFSKMIDAIAAAAENPSPEIATNNI
ncbi:MAG: NAD(P)-dependent oxidoreductase [Anaerolineaceae bacterium]|nr:NAD(P)-dependent oxidoreductase [Anaerolineaceae bacterium]